ncbi:MAG: hypothetical protein ABIE74_01230 [Pseudomonadota bacterium]
MKIMHRYFKNTNLKNQRGIALMLVLSSLVLFTAFAIEFAYDTNISAHLSANDRSRLQAEYLGRSAYNFTLLELKFDKVFKQIIKNQNLGAMLGEAANEPLCKQFPISTGMIKYMVLGEGEAPEGAPEEVSKMTSMSKVEGAKEFIDFAGDFDGQCFDVAGKINLNSLALYNPDANRDADGLNEYDRFKQFLISFMRQQAFEGFFEGNDFTVEDIVNNIGDWVDPNDQMNVIGGVSSTSERGPYEKVGAKYPVRNQKFLSKDELYLVAGVDDVWLTPMNDYFTVYGSTGIDPCQADDIVVAGILARFLSASPDYKGIRIDQPEIMEKFLTAIHDGCAQGGDEAAMKQNITKSLVSVLGQYVTGGVVDEKTLKGFIDSLGIGGGVFTLINSGQVGNTTVRINSVVDVREEDPNKWQLLYWRMY